MYFMEDELVSGSVTRNNGYITQNLKGVVKKTLDVSVQRSPVVLKEKYVIGCQGVGKIFIPWKLISRQKLSV